MFQTLILSYIYFSSSRPILDAEDRVIVILAGQPYKDWDGVHQRCFHKIQAARAACTFPPSHLHHRRGNYGTHHAGASFGGGETEPGNLANTKKNTEVIERLMNDQDFIQVAAFADGLLLPNSALLCITQY